MKLSDRSVYAGVGLLCVLFLVADLLVPLGVAGGMPYVVVVLLTLGLPDRRSTYAMAAITSVLVGVGFVGSPAGADQWIAVVNRSLAVAGIWVAAVVTDQFKRNQYRVREANSTVEAILDAAPDGIVTFDEAGRIRRFSTTAEEMFGYDEAEIEGAPVRTLLDEEEGETLDEAFWRPLVDPDDHRTRRDAEFTARTRNGDRFPMRLALSRVSTPHGDLFTALLQDVSGRRELEKELAGLSEPERQKIGHELNESLGQMLSGIGLLTEDVVRELDEKGVDTVGEVVRISNLLKKADQHVREVTNRLVPVNLEANQFAEALEDLAQTTEDHGDLQCRVIVQGPGTLEDNTTATHLYRIAQEAITNAIRHGNARTVLLRLHLGRQKLRLRIEDDGTGFEGSLEEIRRMGIRIMEYRARLIGATLTVRSDQDAGTAVTCTLPLTSDRR